MDAKTDALITFLRTCEDVSNSAQFFNFGDLIDGSIHFITESDDVYLQREYIDGSVLKRYTLNLDLVNDVSTNKMVVGYDDANVDNFTIAQNVIDWINEQADTHNYPDFGENCIIDEMGTFNTKPEMLVVDTQAVPPSAIYRVSIYVDYLDISKQLK